MGTTGPYCPVSSTMETMKEVGMVVRGCVDVLSSFIHDYFVI